MSVLTTGIKRLNVGTRMSMQVIHNGTIYLSGQVGNPDSDGNSVTKQTKTILQKVEKLLEGN